MPTCRDVRTCTPWGRADTAETFGPGVIRYNTPGHGGFHLSQERNARVHPLLRNKDGWYEEDCEWAIVAHTFPELFDERTREDARRTLRTWRPFEVEQIIGDVIPLAESYVKRRKVFEAMYATDWVTTAAFCSGHPGMPGVPEGMVGVVATIGGKRQGLCGVERWFHIPEVEYDQRGEFGFVVDTNRHTEVPSPGRKECHHER